MKNKKIKSAYSLLELSIALAIISVLIAGGISVSGGVTDSAKINITKQKMDIIYKAMGSFLTTNERLPCPALLTTLKTDTSNYGNEVGAPGNCTVSGAGVQISGNLIYGMIPVATLGLSAEMGEDAFGSKFVYMIDRRFTINSAAAPSASGFAGVTTVIFSVDETFGSVTSRVTSEAIFILMSHGPNKNGAFPANSATQNSIGSDACEVSNSISPASPFFNNTVCSYDGNSDIFDDILFFKSRAEMITDFGLVNLVACTTSAGTGFLPTTGYYDQMSYRSTPCPSPNDYMTPTSKCGRDGNWIQLVICP